MKRSKKLGFLPARVRSSKLGRIDHAIDGVIAPFLFVEVDLEVDVDPAPLTLDPAEMETFRGLRGVASGRERPRVIRWRGGLSAAAIHRTVRCLLVMGAEFPTNDPTDLRGVGSRPFLAEVVSVECDLEETHGTAGVHRLFVRSVVPAGGAS